MKYQTNIVRMVIGSWGSYNEYNERALGSKWLNFDDFNDWDEIVEELKKQGFQLDGIDEELFVQDIEGVPTERKNCDYVHPKKIFELIKKSCVLDEQRKYDTMEAFCEVRSFDEWADLVNNHEDRWDDDIYLYICYDWDDYGREMFEACCYELPDSLECYFDFERFGRDCNYYNATEYSGGIIEINR